MAIVWGGVAGAVVLLWFTWDLPRPESALAAIRRPGLTLEDRGGQVFARYGDTVGTPLRLSQMPPFLPQAVVAVEDRRFWQHGGLDFRGIARAALADLMAGHVVQGGSTLTQQVAKNLFLSDARTLRRKVQEMLLTFWLTRHFTRRQILEIYFNRIYLGAGAWGVDAAARVYFGISATRLQLWQAAVIAGLPRAPSAFNPLADPKAAKTRAKQVLAAMVRAHDITRAQADAAAMRIVFPPHGPRGAGWFADWVSEQARPTMPAGQDAVLHTTLDPHLQTIAEHALAGVLAGWGQVDGVHQGAVVVLDAATGAVRALVGGADYATGPYDRAVLARRQPGSAFKPFVWLAALEKGARPDQRVLDAPIRFGAWHPRDFSRHYQGWITLTRALADSVNTAAIRLLIRAGGPRAVAAVARRLGIADRLSDNDSIALGTGDVGLLELAAAYAPFFNGGLRVHPYGITGLSADGRAVPESHPSPAPVVPPALAAMMRQMMMAVVTGGTGTAAAVPGLIVAGKTGTTEDYRDAWFVGGAAGRIIGVWMGNDDATPTKGVTGGSLPARVFHDIAASLR